MDTVTCQVKGIYNYNLADHAEESQPSLQLEVGIQVDELGECPEGGSPEVRQIITDAGRGAGPDLPAFLDLLNSASTNLGFQRVVSGRSRMEESLGKFYSKTMTDNAGPHMLRQ